MKLFGRLAAILLIAASAEESIGQVVETTPSRYSISFGMGAGVHSAPRVADYISSFGVTESGQRVDEFSSMLELYFAPWMRVEPEWGVGLEYAFLTKTHTVGSGPGLVGAEFTYNVHMPTALVHYVVDGSSYYFKFGGGAGYHFATMIQTLRSVGAEETFSTEGFGLKLEAMGYTKFDDTFFGNIGADLRWDFLGALTTDSGLAAIDRTTNTTAKMQFFSVSLKFGVCFQL